MAEQQKSPFNRVSNGYDPRQVAAFAAEALTWKQELAAARKRVDRYESVLGSIETVEREAAEIIDEAEQKAAEIVEQAEKEAAEILEMARDQVAHEAAPESEDPVPEDADRWLTPRPTGDETPDPVEEIFEPPEVEVPDPEEERERWVAAATANLWKRRGVIAPPE